MAISTLNDLQAEIDRMKNEFMIKMPADTYDGYIREVKIATKAYLDSLFGIQDTIVYYLQKEMVDGDVFFLITGDTLEMPEEFGSIMDALLWLSGKSIPVKVVYLLSDGEEIDASALKGGIEFTVGDDDEYYFEIKNGTIPMLIP